MDAQNADGMGVHLETEGTAGPLINKGDGIPNADMVDESLCHRPPGQGLTQVRDDPRQAHGGTRPAVGQASGADENFHGLSRHCDGVYGFLHDPQLLFKIKNAGRQIASAFCGPARVG